MSSVILVLFFVAYLGGVVLTSRFKRLLRESSAALPDALVPRGALDTSARQSMAFLGAMLTRKYASTQEPRIRVAGDLVLANFVLQMVLLLLFALLVSGRL